MGAERLRMLVVTAFVAVRLLQMRGCLFPKKGVLSEEISCDSVPELDEWKILWIWENKITDKGTAPGMGRAHDS